LTAIGSMPCEQYDHLQIAAMTTVQRVGETKFALHYICSVAKGALLVLTFYVRALCCSDLRNLPDRCEGVECSQATCNCTASSTCWTMNKGDAAALSDLLVFAESF